MTSKGKTIKKAPIPDKPAGETSEQLVRRIKRDMIWVIVSAVVAMGLGLVAGQLIKF